MRVTTPTHMNRLSASSAIRGGKVRGMEALYEGERDTNVMLVINSIPRSSSINHSEAVQQLIAKGDHVLEE